MGEKTETPIVLNNKNIILSAYKNENNSQKIRLFNASSNNQNSTLKLGTQKLDINFNPFEVKTFAQKDGVLTETDMF